MQPMPYQPPPQQSPPQQAYNKQQYQPYPPQYQYPPQPPPKQRISNNKIVAIIVVLVLLIVMIPIIAGILSVYKQPETAYGLRVENSNGDWMIIITSGSENAGNVTLRVTDVGAGAIVYSSRVNAMDGAIGGFYDINNNGKLDTGDHILLFVDSNVGEGMKVELLNGNSVLGTIKSLPRPSGGSENPVGLSVVKNSNGDWLISVTSGGGQNLAKVYIRVTNPTTGALVVLDASYYHALTPGVRTWGAVGNETGVYNDNNGDDKIDARDSILLYNAGNHGGMNLAGMKLQLLKGENSIGTIEELPA